MASNLLENVKQALTGFPVNRIVAWLDSSVALHWIRGKGEYKQFVSNRVHKIQEKSYIEWRHVSTHENPADLASRGGIVDHSSTMWWHGPDWLSDPEKWPQDIQTYSTDETQAEAKAVKELFAVAVQEPRPDTDELDRVMEKYDYWRAIRVTSWVYRFVHNAKSKRKERIKGPLTTEETRKQVIFWVKRIQSRCEETNRFKDQQLQLNLKKDEEGIYRCMGRIQGHYPIYLPDNDICTEKLVTHSHRLSCHGGVGLTMSKFREKFWTPKLRSMTKRLIKNCYTCKRFRVSPVAAPPPGNLPRDRTEGTAAYQVVGVDYAGPIRYRTRSKKEGKAYIILYACSLTRGLYLELLPNQETEEFIRSLKRLIARRGRPQKIYSDNAKTFVAAAKWLRGVMRDEKLHNWLSQNEIKWQFNVSRAPWWGGQFERMVSLVKQALYKSIGQSHLTWCELQDVLLDIEVALNNRPLSYVEDDIELPTLTPNSLMFGLPNLIPEQDYQDMDEPELRRRARNLQRCKDVLWGRWTNEYLKGLRERHNLKHNTKELAVKVGDVVIIKSDERNRNKWKLGIVEKLIRGRDGVVRVAKLRAGKSYLERPIQHLYPLELACDRATPAPQPTLNANAPAFRPKRDAAVSANLRIHQNIADEEQED